MSLNVDSELISHYQIVKGGGKDWGPHQDEDDGRAGKSQTPKGGRSGIKADLSQYLGKIQERIDLRKNVSR